MAHSIKVLAMKCSQYNGVGIKGLWLRCLIAISVIGVVLLGLVACDQSDKKVEKKPQHVISVKKESYTTRLSFTGKLKPIQLISVLSPVDGRVATLTFDYGGHVKRGDRLLTINSPQLADDFKKAVNDYLQKKDRYASGTQSFQGDQALYRAGIISKEDFTSSQSQYENKVIDFFQSRLALEKVLDEVDISPAAIERLTLKDTTAINRLLQRKFKDIVVNAPGKGVALFPIATSSDGSSGSSDDQTGKLTVGSAVKTGQLLLSIGDLSGLSVQVLVSEININRVKSGMKATITGDAFPGIALTGRVTIVSSQANPAQGDSASLSLFNVMVEIPKLTPAQRSKIHVGMTAKVDIVIPEKPQILIPLVAVKTEGNTSQVMVLSSTGKRRAVTVITGATTPDGRVVIVHGLTVGDRIVWDD